MLLRAEQSRAEQSRAEQRRAEQSSSTLRFFITQKYYSEITDAFKHGAKPCP